MNECHWLQIIIKIAEISIINNIIFFLLLAIDGTCGLGL